MLYQVAKGLILLDKYEKREWFKFLKERGFKREDYVHVISIFLSDIKCDYEEMTLNNSKEFMNENIEVLSKGDFFRENLADMFSCINEEGTLGNKEIYYEMYVTNEFFTKENLW